MDDYRNLIASRFVEWCPGYHPMQTPERHHHSVIAFSNLDNFGMNLARDLQERLGILALLELSASFRICKLQILFARRENDPVSGHHISKDLAATKKLVF
jgi:hypothetical protein